MKLNWNFKKKELGVEADVERIVEKKLDNNEKDWKDKLLTKHEVNKEMQELKHNQKVEMEKIKQKRKSWFQQKSEEKIRLKEMKMEEKLRKEQQAHKEFLIGIALFFMMIIFLLILGILEKNGII